MKKIGFLLLMIGLIIIGTILYIGNQQPELDQPLVSEEDELNIVTEDDTDAEDNEAEQEETQEESENESFSKRLSQAFQGAFDQLFQREVEIVAIGDSLTRGVGDETEQHGYVGILERSLNQEKKIANVENFGVPGNRSDHLLERLDEPEIVNALEKADIILITIGANDIMHVARQNMLNLEIETFMNERAVYEQRLGGILEKMTDYNEKANIYLLGIYNPFEMYFQEIKELNQIVNAWNNTASSFAEELTNVTFIPVVDLFSRQDDSVYANDNFHPNYQGYYLMAERVLDYISEEER